MSEEHLDMVMINELKEVMEEDFPVLITTYLDDTRMRIESLSALFERLDHEELRAVGHSLKGSSMNMGINLLASIAKQVEESAKDGRSDEAARLLPEIEAEFALVEKTLKAML